MGLNGSNSFVIEGAKGKELYAKILKSVSKCVEYDTEYVLGEVNDKVYTIYKEKRLYCEYDVYTIFVSEKDNQRIVAYSSFYVEDFKYENDVMTMWEEWRNNIGAFATYFIDTEMYKEPGFYFYSDSEYNVAGSTNDVNGKYFEKDCVIFDGSYFVGDGTIPANYNELPFEEQIAICGSLPKDKIYYETTKIIDLNKLWR